MSLTQSGAVVLDGSGNGTVRLPQVPTYRIRSYIQVAVSIDTGDASALTGGTARMYREEALPSNFLTGTRTPWLDTSTLSAAASELRSPQQLVVVFSDCDPGATASVAATYIERPIRRGQHRLDRLAEIMRGV